MDIVFNLPELVQPIAFHLDLYHYIYLSQTCKHLRAILYDDHRTWTEFIKISYHRNLEDKYYQTRSTIIEKQIKQFTQALDDAESIEDITKYVTLIKYLKSCRDQAEYRRRSQYYNFDLISMTQRNKRRFTYTIRLWRKPHDKYSIEFVGDIIIPPSDHPIRMFICKGDFVGVSMDFPDTLDAHYLFQESERLVLTILYKKLKINP